MGIKMKLSLHNWREPTIFQPEATFWDIDFKLFKKQDSENLTSFPTQQIQTEKAASGREPWLDHLKNLHPSLSQEDAKPVS